MPNERIWSPAGKTVPLVPLVPNDGDGLVAARRDKASGVSSIPPRKAFDPSGTARLPGRTDRSQPAPQTPMREPKKKQNSLFSFLTLKEPSQSAFEQYAQQQLKQAAAKGGKSAPGFSGVSSQKLPPTVPKVNSRWDGLPNSAKDKEAAKRRNRQSVISALSRHRRSPSRGSLTESSSSASIHTVHGAPPSLVGSVHRDNAARHSMALSPTSTRLSPTSTRSSPVEAARMSPPVPSPASPARFQALQPTHASGTARSVNSSSDGASDFANDVLSEPVTPRGSSRDESPLTPQDPQLFSNPVIYSPSETPSPLLEETEEDATEQPQWPLVTNPEEVILKASGPDVLGPPFTAKKKSKVASHGFLAGEAQELHISDDEAESPRSILKGRSPPIRPSPPLCDAYLVQAAVAWEVQTHPLLSSQANAKGWSADLAGRVEFSYADGSSPALSRSSSVSTRINISTRELPDTSLSSSNPQPIKTFNRRTSAETVLSLAESDASTVAPSVTDSVAMSEMSAQWFQSPKERLGLGGNIRHSTAAPWETRHYEGDVGEVVRERERERAVTPTPGDGGGKKKRFSMRKKLG